MALRAAAAEPPPLQAHTGCTTVYLRMTKAGNFVDVASWARAGESLVSAGAVMWLPEVSMRARNSAARKQGWLFDSGSYGFNRNKISFEIEEITLVSKA